MDTVGSGYGAKKPTPEKRKRFDIEMEFKIRDQEGGGLFGSYVNPAFRIHVDKIDAEVVKNVQASAIKLVVDALMLGTANAAEVDRLKQATSSVQYNG